MLYIVSCFLLTGSKAKRLLMATILMKMFWKKKKSGAYPREWIDDQSATMIWNELKQVSVCGRSDVTNAKVKKESTLRFERQQQKEENQWQSRDQRRKCLDAYAGLLYAEQFITDPFSWAATVHTILISTETTTDESLDWSCCLY